MDSTSVTDRSLISTQTLTSPAPVFQDRVVHFDREAFSERLVGRDIWTGAVDGDVECLKQRLNDGVGVDDLGYPKGIPAFQSGNFYATPLHYAVAYGNAHATLFLIRNGARPDIQSSMGLTPLDYARKRNYEEIIRILHGDIVQLD